MWYQNAAILTLGQDLRKQLKHKKITLVGHSWGGLLAMHYAITYPNNLSALILISPAPATSIGFKTFIEEYTKRITNLNLGEKIRKIQNLDSMQNGDTNTVVEYYRTLFSVYFYNKEDINKLSLQFTPQSALSGFKVTNIFTKDYFSQSYDLRANLKKLTLPVLIIHGDYDPIPLHTIEEIKNSIKDAKLVVLKDCGHFPYIEQPIIF